MLKTLYNHPTISNEVGTKRINRASIIMMMLFAPLLIVSFALVLITMNIFLVVQSGVWFAIVTIASMALQNGSNFHEMKTLNPWLTRQNLLVREGQSYEIYFPNTVVE